jgi:hypothetical protein
MKVKGIIDGKSITLLEPITIADGTEIIIDIPDSYSQKKPQWEEIEKVSGFWENDEEITQIFAEIDRERCLNYFNQLNI